MIGKTISHYKILDELGRGGMGTVYKAQDTKLDRFVALKFLPHHLSQDEENKQRFIHEAKAASALNHPNIATIYEIDEADGQMFIAMEYIEGQSLQDVIVGVNDRSPLPIELALDYAIQIAEGLAKAHAKGIIHRDIKPANILVSEDGLVKIVDFGLAKLAGRTMLTKEGTTLGTVAYMSPEQTHGAKVDHRTDIWALGAVIYEMVSGKQPFAGDYEQAVMYSIMNEDPEPLTALRTGVSKELEQIVLKALAKNPDERYQHVDEIITDLKRLKKKPDRVKRPSTVTPVRKVRNRTAWYVTTALALVVLIVVGRSLFTRKQSPINSIAVLPLKNLSGDPEQEYFVEGMHEELITDLSRISTLKVISRTSVMRYKGTDKPMPQIARELNVDALIEGSVLRVGGQVRITAQLIRGPTDEHMWAGSYDRDLRNVLALISEVAQVISRKIEVVLTKEEARLVRTGPVNPAAHEAYLKGRYFLNKFTGEGFQKSLVYFQQAISIDSSFAQAWAGLAGAHTMIAYYGNAPAREAISQARAAASKAVELDDQSAEAYTVLGWIDLYEWQWSAAKEAFQKALDLNSNSVNALHGYGDYLTLTGHLEEGLSYVKRTRENDPLAPSSTIPVTAHLYMMQRYDEAIADALKLLELDPNFPVHGWLAKIYWQKGMYEEAMREYRIAWRRDPKRLQALERGSAQSGPKGGMRAVAELLVARSKVKFIDPFNIASEFARAGEIEQALAWLERAYQEHTPELIYVNVRPQFDPLHSDPRFQDLLQRVGLPAQTNQ